MGSESSKNVAPTKTPEQLKQEAEALRRHQERFSTKNQDNLAMGELLDAFRDNKPDKAIDIVRSINNNLIDFKEGSTFKGATDKIGDYDMKRFGIRIGWWCPTLDLTNFLDDEREFRAEMIDIDGVKPIVMAYFLTIYNAKHTLSVAMNKRLQNKRNHNKAPLPEINYGQAWLDVVKEMIKNPKFMVDPFTDTIFGYKLIDLMMCRSDHTLIDIARGHWDEGSEIQRKYMRPFMYDAEVFKALLTKNPEAKYTITNKEVLINLLKDDNYQVLTDILKYCDCSKLLVEYNFLYDVETTSRQRPKCYYGNYYDDDDDEPERPSSDYIKLFQKYGQVESLEHPDHKMPCNELALKLQHYNNFLTYQKLPVTDSCLETFTDSLTAEAYEKQYKSVTNVIQVFIQNKSKEQMMAAAKKLTNRKLFNVANYIFDCES
jgi:hypothetical protein